MADDRRPHAAEALLVLVLLLVVMGNARCLTHPWTLSRYADTRW